MAKLLPPLIEATIPAFYSEGTGMVSITIPFSMNRAVSQASVKGLAIKIKTAQSSSYLYSTEVLDAAYFDVKSSSPNVIVQIDNEEFLSRIKVGQYYKFQIAYIDISGEIGYFSTVAVGKYTNKPTQVKILNTSTGINTRAYRYTGFYKNADITEKAYSYSFNLYNADGVLEYTTGELLHNSENDIVAGESQDSFDLTMDLEQNKKYYLQYKVTTINNLVVYSARTRIVQRETIEPEINTQIIAILNSENGYIEVTLNGEMSTSGSFMLMRACSDSNFNIWDKMEMYRFVNDIPKNAKPFRDFTVEQGKTYQYSLIQYNENELYSNRILSNDKIYVDFEHAFLYDGKRQLKIKYNPKITSLKANVLEAKIDTIGGQYPFVFRNGSVYYREFPISGLISLLSDENQLFYNIDNDVEFTRISTPSTTSMAAGSQTDLTAENFFNERNFKLEVLKWLTNGETKLFRSPGEGNFIVRLMNSSLSPNDQLSRMLHTFSCTAYEIAEFNYNNLINYNLITLSQPDSSVNTTMYWTTVDLSEIALETESINMEKAVTVSFTDMTPGDEIRLVLDNENINVIIGPTGKYIIEREVPIRAMYIIKLANGGYCTYSYYSVQASNFDVIQNIHYGDVPAAQIIGPTEDIRVDLGLVVADENNDYVLNPKTSLEQIYYIKAIRREWTPIYSSNYKFYLSPFDDSIPLAKPNPILLYKEIPQRNMRALRDTGFNFQLTTANSKITLQSIEEAYALQFPGQTLYKPDPDTTILLDAEEMYRDYNKWYSPDDDDAEAEFGFIPSRYLSYDPTLTLYYADGSVEVIDLADNILEEETKNGIKHYTHSARYYYTDKLDTLSKISLGNGVILEIGYQTKNIDYTAESNSETVRNAKQNYETALTNLRNYFINGTIIEDNEEVKPQRNMYGELLQEVQSAYNQIGVQMNEVLD